jgi:hypothetical protein
LRRIAVPRPEKPDPMIAIRNCSTSCPPAAAVTYVYETYTNVR